MCALARVYFDGTLTEPRLDHPECLAVHRDGSLWCGGERGQIFRLDTDGRSLRQVATTEGFSLGLGFDAKERLYVCDLKEAAVFRLDTRTARLERFAEGAGGRRLRSPNFPAVDRAGNVYVSDSHGFHDPGPGIFRFLPDGSGELWYRETIDFANGLALDRDERHLYVVETFGNRIFRLPIEVDGRPGPREEVAHLPAVLPDGIAMHPSGNLYVGCYEPSQILRVRPGGEVEVVVSDPEAHLLCHPTNLAFRGETLYASNLGRWHLTAVDLGEGEEW
ncbi:MAG: SMP-30/gluconolactonase/LRE family protein [Candidatus Dormibacteraceae bacterium]